MFRKKLVIPPPPPSKKNPPKPNTRNDSSSLSSSTSLPISRQPPSQSIKTPVSNPTADRLWTTHYGPSSLDQMIGNTSQFNKLDAWLAEWPNYNGTKRMIVLQGTSGVGKTCAIKLVCQKYGYSIRELNASQECYGSASSLQETINKIIVPPATSFKTMFRKQKVIQKQVLLLDEMDEMTMAGGVLVYMIQLTDTSPIPLIATVNDLDYSKYKSLWKATNLLILKLSNFPDPAYQAKFAQLAHHILKMEGRSRLTDTFLKQLIRTCNGDIRAAINYLQFSTISSASTKKAKIIINTTDGANNMLLQDYVRWMLTNKNIQLTDKQLSLYDQHSIQGLDFFHDQVPKILPSRSFLCMEDTLDALSEGDMYEARTDRTFTEYNHELNMIKTFVMPLSRFQHHISHDEVKLKTLPYFIEYPEIYPYQKRRNPSTEENMMLMAFSKQFTLPICEIRSYSVLFWTQLTEKEWQEIVFRLHISKQDELVALTDSLHGTYSCKDCTKQSFGSQLPPKKWFTLVVTKVNPKKRKASQL